MNSIARTVILVMFSALLVTAQGQTVAVPSYYNWVGFPYDGANLWFDTGVDVAAGQTLSITASGVVNFGGGVMGGPDGTSFNGSGYWSQTIIPNTYLSSLIGKIGGTTAVGTGTPVPEGTPGMGSGFVGSSYSEVIPDNGRLFLTVNDMIWFNDNSGTFTATITVVPEPSLLPLAGLGAVTLLISRRRKYVSAAGASLRTALSRHGFCG